MAMPRMVPMVCCECDEQFEQIQNAVGVYPETCPNCDSPRFNRDHRIQTPHIDMGPTPHKPFEARYAGLRFESRREREAWLKANPKTRIMDKSDPSWRKHEDKVREKREKVSKKMGFRDLDERREKGQKK